MPVLPANIYSTAIISEKLQVYIQVYRPHVTLHRLFIIPNNPPPTMVDTMHDVALTSYNRPESAFNFEGWQEAPERGLRQLLPCSPPQATAAPSTDHSPQAVIHSVRLQFQPGRYKGKAPVQSLVPTPSNTEFQGLGAQLQQLQQERKRPSPRFRSFKTSRQSTRSCFNALPPIYRMQPTLLWHIRHNYPVA